MWAAAVERLSQECAHVNRLNVFPVADRDTGHNMLGTLQAAVRAQDAVVGGTLAQLAEALAAGAVWGARGNSGVILSQWMRGFLDAAPDAETWEAARLAAAFRLGAEVATRQVHEPVEGTILTVMRRVADAVSGDLADAGHFFETAVQAARQAVLDTPAQLPVLAAAGVVDAGAQGWTVLLEGLQAGLAPTWTARARPPARGGVETARTGARAPAALRYPYDVEALLEPLAGAPPLDTWSADLARLGDSIVVAAGPGGRAKVHVHTDTPSRLMARLEEWAALTEMTVLDMRRQVAESHPPEGGPWAVADVRWHSLLRAAGLTPALPDPALDRPGAVWLNPTGPLTEGWAVAGLGALLIAASYWWPGMEANAAGSALERAAAAVEVQVERRPDGYRVQGGPPVDLDGALGATGAQVASCDMAHLYLDDQVPEEEAARWETVCQAEAVRVANLPVWVLVVAE